LNIALKSAQFPATWRVTGGYHTAGTEIVGQTSNLAERIITIDDLLVSSVFIADIDEAKSHFDYRSTYSAETGRFLAANWDKNVMQVMALAARASATVTGAVGGTVLTSATTLYKTSATDLAAGIYAAVQAFDEKDIPITSERNALVRPAQYYLLAQSTALVNRDWAEGNGNYGTGKLLKIGGANIIKTNHVPSTNVTTGPTAYQGDFTKTAAIITTKEAVGTVKLLDLSMRMSYDERRLGTLIVSKYAVGHGLLRPECAVELVTTT
jgi:autotransporter adhesin